MQALPITHRNETLPLYKFSPNLHFLGPRSKIVGIAYRGIEAKARVVGPRGGYGIVSVAPIPNVGLIDGLMDRWAIVV